MITTIFKSSIRTYFRFIKSDSGKKIDIEDSDLNVMVLNYNTRISILINGGKEEMAHPYQMKLFSPHTKLSISSDSGFETVLFYFDYVGKYCDSKICGFLEAEKPVFTNESSSLNMDETMKSFLHLMLSTYSGCLNDRLLMEIKYKELFFILCSKLDIADFARFLHPAMTWYDPVFRRKVLDHFEDDYRVKSLSDSCGYSYKEFCKKFMKEFGQMPSIWLKEKMKDLILKRLVSPNTQLKELADELKMPSVQQLTRFCKTNFGKTPSQIRKELSSL